MTPTVSVVMSVLNGEKYLCEAIDSILNQTYTDFEFIIIDDGSVDSSPSILSKYALQDERIHIHNQQRNMGLANSVNLGIRLAEGKYIARMDADDVSISNRLALQVDYLEKNPDVGVLGTQMNILRENQQFANKKYEVPIFHDQIAWALMFDRSFAHPSVMLKRSLLLQSGGYDETYPVSQDRELWTRLVWLTRFANLPDYLINYRTHPSATSVMKANMQSNNHIKTLQRFASRILDKEIPSDLINHIIDSQREDHHLPEAVINQVISTIFDLFDGYIKKNIFSSKDLEKVHSEMVMNVIKASRCDREIKKKKLPSYQDISYQLKRLLPSPVKKIIKKLLFHRVTIEPPLTNITPKTVLSKGNINNQPSGLSIIILSYERMKSLKSLLGSLLTQKLDGIQLEVIVCNNSPSINLRKSSLTSIGRMLQKFPDVRILNSSHNWRTDIRYSLATLAKNETILFLDDDLVLLYEGFVQYMYDSFRTIGSKDLLSCWNMLFVEWQTDILSSVFFEFKKPEITELTKSDQAGPGICMFNKQILTPKVLQEVMRSEHRQTDMGFSLAAYLEHGSESYFLPSYRMIKFHAQYKHKALDDYPGRSDTMTLLYKEMLAKGYIPVLGRISAQEYEASNEKKAIDSLKKYTRSK